MKRPRMSSAAGIIVAVALLATVPAASASHGTARTTAATCLRGQLSVRSNGTNGAAGTIHGAWVFKNVSLRACSLDGYPGLQLYGRSGRPTSTTVVDDLAPAPTDVELAPDGSATFYSSYNDVSSGRHTCPTSAVVQITSPGAADSLFIPAQLEACAGIVHVSAVLAGVHGP